MTTKRITNVMMTKARFFSALLFPMIISQTVWAATAGNTTVRTQQGSPLTIDLTNEVSGTNVLIELVPPQFTAQQATVELILPFSVIFTPDPNFSGVVSFSYTATDADGTATGTVTVTVVAFDAANVVSVVTQVKSPEQSVGSKFLEITCPGLQDLDPTQLTPAEVELLERCNLLVQAAAQGLNANVRRALQQLAPEEAAAQIRAGRSLVGRQLKNIGARLAGLRSGARGVTVDGLSLNIGDETVPGKAVQYLYDSTIRGGGASADPYYSGVGMFASGVVGLVQRDPTQQEDGFELQTNGATVGMDFRIGRSAVLGGAFGFATSNVNLDEKVGTLDVSGASASQYGTFYATDHFYMDYILTYNSHQYSNQRNINFQPDPDQPAIKATAVGDTDSSLIAASISAGWDFIHAGGMTMAGKLRTDYVNSVINGYKEKGAGAFNLKIEDQSFNSSLVSAGLRVQYALKFPGGVFLPQIDLDWEHQMNDEAVVIKGEFLSNRFGSTFAFSTDQQDPDYFTAGVGFSMIFVGGNTMFLQLESTLDRLDYSDYHLATGLRLEF